MYSNDKLNDKWYAICHDKFEDKSRDLENCGIVREFIYLKKELIYTEIQNKGK